eukprot:760626-Pyramimonas_sp.AAC.1
MEFCEVEEHEVAYSWLQAFRMWPGSGILGGRRARSVWQFAKSAFGHEFGHGSPDAAPTPLWSHLLLSFDPTRNLSAKAVT